MQSEIFAPEHSFGNIFFNQASMSAKGIPQVAAVLGSCTAGGTFQFYNCTEAITVQLSLTGPKLVMTEPKLLPVKGQSWLTEPKVF